MMVAQEKMCLCGKPLHYKNPRSQEYVERQIAELGERVKVKHVETGRIFMVPRHYIALHGLKGEELPALGFEEA